MKRHGFDTVLEECLERLRRGDSLEACLAEHPEHAERLEPLLRLTADISALEEIKPSREFVGASKERLLGRIRREEAPVQEQRRSLRGLPGLVRDFFTAPVSQKRYLLPAAAVAVIALVLTFGQVFFFNGSVALAAPCTLNVFSGDVAVLAPGTDEWVPGTDRMGLEPGTVIKTGESSHAILTFFTGASTLKLEPGTEVIIERLENAGDTDTVTLLQNSGETWSFVHSTEPGGIDYRVGTPSATAFAVGTLFKVEVDDAGDTVVETTEGTVRVTAQGGEVVMGNARQVSVRSGEVPGAPAPVSPPLTEIVISVENASTLSVTDPSGSSTGNFRSGFSYNQITGSQSFTDADGPYVITVHEPVSGQYRLILSCDSDEKTGYTIVVNSGGEEVFRHAGYLLTNTDKLWLASLEMSVSDGIVSRVALDEIEPLKTGTVDDIVKVSPPYAQQEKEKADAGKNKDKDKPDPSKDKEKPDTGKDKEPAGQDKNPNENKPDKDKGKPDAGSVENTPDTAGDPADSEPEDSPQDSAPGQTKKK